MTSPLDPLLRPRSVAVVGAARKRGSISAEVFHNLLAREFQGPVHPVSARASVVQSVRAYPTVDSIPDPVDLAVLVVPAREVLETAEACGRRGVRALVVITAGFAETGPEGARLQDALVECARRYGMRVVGPNCLGVLNANPEIRLDATFAPHFPPFGGVAVCSQSGALGLAILDLAREVGMGVSSFVSIGNRADVSAVDLLEHWEHDPDTRVILLYLENLGDPRRFLEVARRVSREKPIALVKSGRTEAGRRAASSHTGALAGLDVAVDAVLGQCGVIRTDTIHELFDVGLLLASQPVPASPRVAILTNAGGPGIMATDACESRGLAIPPLPEATRAALREFLPEAAAVGNPVDMIASATAEDYERSLRILLADDTVASVLVLFVTPIVTAAVDVARAVTEAAAGSHKPIAACFMGSQGVPEALAHLRRHGVVTYAFPEAAAAALARAACHGAYRSRVPTPPPALVVDRDAVTGVLAAERDRGETGWLPPDAVRRVLDAYGIRRPRQAVAADGEAAAAAAPSVGFPLVFKLVSSTIVHKSDVGGVKVGLRDAAEVRAAYDEVLARLAALGRAAELEGALLQEQITGGVETFVGATRDEQFGHLVGFGLGGLQVELLRDVVFRAAPVSPDDAADMIGGIRGRALLEGFRSGPVASRPALVELLLRVSRLVEDHPEIAELDLNPVLATADGAIAVDARIRVGC
ncbi:MAG: acetate--CoA ligase family protein [Polyangiaceae bacterium]|nr:acetate--CoA ligase family protein [Polyangiaceae bacterium]